MNWDLIDHLTHRWPVELDWSIAMGIAWVAGELAARYLKLPRISMYGVVGFALAHNQLGLLPPISGSAIGLLANIAMGLVLFELGYRINVGWLRINPWIGLTSAVEAAFTFSLVYVAARWLGLSPIAASLIASLAMSTSPAAVLSVLNERGSSGQVTERTLHLTAFSCILAILTFKAVTGFVLLEQSGDLLKAIWHSLLVFGFSMAIGAVVGLGVPKALQLLRTQRHDPTTPFAIAVVALVVAMQWLDYSPALATLAFGLVARSRRTVLIHPERGFGSLGALLLIVLFVFTSATLDAKTIIAGAGVGVILILARALAKTAALCAFARISGITTQKGFYTAMAMMPVSAFVLLLLEPGQGLAQTALGELAGLTAMVFLLEILGPVATRWAVVKAGEAPEGRH